MLPDEKAKEAPVKKRKRSGRWKKVLLFIATVIAALALYWIISLRQTQTADFVDTFYQVEDDKIQTPMRIVLLTDLHLHEFGENNCELIDEIIRLKPDMIAMAGDMMNEDDPEASVVIDLCRNLADVAPICFSYGNHEKQAIRVDQISTMNEDLEALGVHVLHNRWETIRVNGNVIDIGGLSANPGTMDASYTQSFWKDYMEKASNYRLLLVHYPTYFIPGGELVGANIDMALCGHLHGGIIVIPRIGGLYHPSTGFFPDMSDGCHRVEDTWVVVSRGLGSHGILPRINNPPELVVLDIY